MRSKTQIIEDDSIIYLMQLGVVVTLLYHRIYFLVLYHFLVTLIGFEYCKICYI